MNNIPQYINDRQQRRDEVAAHILELRSVIRSRGVNTNRVIRMAVADAFYPIPERPTTANLVKELNQREMWLATAQMPEGLPCGADDAWLERYDAEARFTAALRAYLEETGADV